MTGTSLDYDKGPASALELLSQDCSTILSKTKSFKLCNKDLVPTAFQNVWIKFAAQHQKSPSHINNNVQSCTWRRRNGIKESRTMPQETYVCRHDKCLTEVKPSDLFHVKFFGFLGTLLKLVEVALIILTLLVLLYGILLFHKPTQSLISRNTQDLIYPIMRRIRLTALPLVRQFPFLTDFYEESCLISNPYYFQMNSIDCWPCETVRHVIDLTGFSNFSSAYHDSGIPFVVKDAYKTEVDENYLRTVYFQNPEVLSQACFESNVHGLTSFQGLFSNDEDENTPMMSTHEIHISWKINRVVLTRILRKYFPKPYFIPEATEVSIQHFLYLDGYKSRSYSLPLTEFANVFVTQVSGSRYIALIPRENCHHECRVVSTLLEPNDVLFYNWLFWRPRSVPVDPGSSNFNPNISITYIGSFY